jgi:hypothetical protein
MLKAHRHNQCAHGCAAQALGGNGGPAMCVGESGERRRSSLYQSGNCELIESVVSLDDGVKADGM